MPAPAEPILASALLPTCHASECKTKRHFTGCKGIDIALGGVLRHGRMCCLSAESNSGGRELCEAYIVSHLLSSSGASATVIDTTLSFDVRKVYRRVIAGLEPQTGAEQQAMEVLGRLKIMKVFDFEGLTDSVSELREALEGKDGKVYMRTEEKAVPKGTIGDSEDEDEMLDSPSPPSRPQREQNPNDHVDQVPQKNLLLIDTISHVAAPMIKNRHVEGQALLTSFVRSLTHLTTSYDFCTILLNDTVSVTSLKDECPSVFADCTVRPALGRSFEHMLDAHLLVHQIPSKISTAQASDSVSVVEVLQDRHGGSLGQWAAFSVIEGGRLEDLG